MIFTGISMWATAVLGPGALSIAGLSPAVTAAIFTTGRSLLWSMAANAVMRPDVPRLQVMATLSQTDAPRIRAYGRNLLGGQRAFFEASSGHLHQVVVSHHGPVDGLVRIWIDGEKVTTEPTPAVADGGGRINRYLAVYFKRGAGNGGDYRGVFAGESLGWKDLHEAFPDLWTLAHRLEGQATFYTVFGDPADEDFQKFFPKGQQTKVQIEIRASRVRNIAGDLVYSENAGLCIRDVMTHRDGWDIPAARLDDSSWTAFANRCGQAVPMAAGGTEPRYRLCGYYSLDDALKNVTERMLSTCDGQIYQTAEGRIGILGGAWSEPDVTITADDILSIDMKDGFDPFTTYNVLRASYVSPEHAYQPTEVAEWRDEALLVTQEERPEQFDVDMCPSPTQLQRLMKIKAAKDRRKWVGTIRTNLVGLKARFPKGDGIHTIRIAIGEPAVDGVYEVMSHSFSIPDGICEIGVGSIDNPYGWSVSEERAPPPTLAQIGRPDSTIPAPAGASLTQVPVRISGDTYGGKLRLTVNSVTRGDLTLQAQVAEGDVSATASGPWTTMGGDRFSAETGILQNEQTYTVRYRWRGQSAWQRAGAVTIVANPNVPAAPTGFQRVGTTGASLRWTNPADNFWKARIFRSPTNSFTGAAFVADVSGLAGQQANYTATQSAGTMHYWVVALNGSSVASPPAGPVPITL